MESNQKGFPEASFEASRLLELVHMDLCRLIKPASFVTSNYFMLFIHECSRKILVYFIREKSDALEAFKVMAMVETQSIHMIKTLCSYHGGEYISNTFKKYC